jgi:hypothetical protein
VVDKDKYTKNKKHKSKETRKENKKTRKKKGKKKKVKKRVVIIPPKLKEKSNKSKIVKNIPP